MRPATSGRFLKSRRAGRIAVSGIPLQASASLSSRSRRLRNRKPSRGFDGDFAGVRGFAPRQERLRRRRRVSHFVGFDGRGTHWLPDAVPFLRTARGERSLSAEGDPARIRGVAGTCGSLPEQIQHDGRNKVGSLVDDLGSLYVPGQFNKQRKKNPYSVVGGFDAHGANPRTFAQSRFEIRVRSFLLSW